MSMKLSDLYQQMLAFIKEAGIYFADEPDALSEIELIDWANQLVSEMKIEIKPLVTGVI